MEFTVTCITEIERREFQEERAYLVNSVKCCNVVKGDEDTKCGNYKVTGTL